MVDNLMSRSKTPSNVTPFDVNLLLMWKIVFETGLTLYLIYILFRNNQNELIFFRINIYSNNRQLEALIVK